MSDNNDSNNSSLQDMLNQEYGGVKLQYIVSTISSSSSYLFCICICLVLVGVFMSMKKE